MAISRSFLMVEAHIRDVWMPSIYKQAFTKAKASLKRSGSFEFDAVSVDGSIVACISSNSGRARQGGLAKTKMNKIRSDILFLLMAEAPRKIMILADKALHEHAICEQQRGRLPSEVEIVLATLSEQIQEILAEAQKTASVEMMANA